MKKIILLSLCLSLYFVAQAATPAITSFSPTTGVIGTTVTISGTNFNTDKTKDIVFFGATMATVTAASATSLMVTVPTGATYQPVSVTDITTGLTAYSTQPFTVTFSCGGYINATSFAVKQDLTTASNPQSVFIGDLDGDGKIELVVTNFMSNSVSVFKNTGTNGTVSFSARQDFTTGTNPIGISIGDLDGDGKQDLAVTNTGSNTVSVFRNTGTSGTISFAAKQDYTTGTTPQSVSIGDLDGDGKPELAVTNFYSNTVSVFRNTSTSGTVSFILKQDFTTGNYPFNLSIGDVDGDGKPDLAVANYNSTSVSVLRNTGTSGTVSFAAKQDFTTGSSPYSVSIGDLDGDGKPELAVANYGSNTVSVLRNTGTSGTVSFASKQDFTTGSNPYSVSIGDVDGDGKPDLAVANSNSNSVSVFRNTGTSGTVSFAAKQDFTTGSGPRSVSIGDLDGDGKPDLAVANSNSNSVSVLKNTEGALTMTSPSATSIVSGATVNIAFTSTMASTYTWIATDNPNTSGESLTIQNSSTLSNTIINNTASVQTVTYTVTPTSTSGCGVGTAQTVTVTINPLLISGISPTNGTATGGTSVVITGTDFSSVTGVTFGTIAASSFTINSATQITATSPAGTGTVHITVTKAGGTSATSSADQFTYVIASSITSFSPASGSVGTLVTITGTGLDSPTAFTIGGVAAIVISNTGTQLVGMVMPGAVTGAVSITTAGGTAAGTGSFMVTATGYPSVQQGAKLVGTGNVGTARQGRSVALSADGNTAIVGGYMDNSYQGAAWIYVRSGSAWTQQGSKLVGTGAVGAAQQGISVALSADGNTALVGGNMDNTNQGAVWVFTRSGTTWSQQGAKLVGTGVVVGNVHQGWSLALSADGNTVMVGGSDDNSGVGAAWVYIRTGTAWTQQGSKLVGTGNTGVANQGYSVALSGDGNTAMVGGSADNTNQGAAWVYTRSGSDWAQQGSKLVGSGASGNALQGRSVALSADGNTAMVGGYYDNSVQGAAWVYARSGTAWAQQGSKLVGTGNTGAAYQGISVALSADGNTAVVGGQGDNGYQGAAWVFTRNGTTWTQQGSKLVGTSATGTPYQGVSIALSADGNTALVGGNGDNTNQGATWVFVQSNTWTGATNTNWATAGNWSTNAIPLDLDDVTIPNVPNQPVVNQDPGTPAVCTNLTIAPGAILTIAAGKALTVSGTLTNNAGTSGLVIKSDGSGTGSLIHNTVGINATVERYIAGWGSIPNHGWHLLSSPVATQVIDPSFTDLTPANYDFYQWQEGTNTWLNQKDGANTIVNFVPGTGYLVAYLTGGTKSFTGPLNAADIACSGLTLSGGSNSGWNLLGNPFPSALTWGTANWSLTNIATTAKVWDEDDAAYDDISSDGLIPAMNGFMVQTTSGTGSLTIPLTARVHNAQPWYKSSAGMLKLIAHDMDNSTAQESIIRVNGNATEGYDAQYDSHFLAGFAPKFYSTAGGEQLSTNTLPGIDNSRVIPMGFVKNAAGNFSIELMENSLMGVSTIYLTDNKTGSITNMGTSPVYNFTSVAGDDANRFLLNFQGVASITKPDVTKDFTVYTENGVITILQTGNLSGKVTVTDMSGRNVATASLMAGAPTRINLQGHPGVYVVSIVSAEGVSNTKIIIN